MSDDEIEDLITYVRCGKVYWKVDETFHEIVSVDLNWLEFKDDPNCIREPAAFLKNGKCIALANCDCGDFYSLIITKTF